LHPDPAKRNGSVPQVVEHLSPNPLYCLKEKKEKEKEKKRKKSSLKNDLQSI
jgi:hypothetical protein